MSKCFYSEKFRPLVLTLQGTLDDLAFRTKLLDLFEDGNEVYNSFASGVNLDSTSKISVSTTEGISQWDNTVERAQEGDISSWYGGDILAYEDMFRGFKSDMIANTVIKIDYNTGEFSYIDANFVGKNGITTINRNILKYKEALINKIRTYKGLESVAFSEDTLDAEVTRIKTESIEAIKNDQSLPIDILNSIVILSNFDTLLTEACPFISIKRGYADNNLEGVDKYIYSGPNVKHFTGWVNSEYADSMDQASDLSKIVLDAIPEISNGKPIKNSFVGLSGFMSAMTAMREALTYADSIELYDLRQEMNKGDKANFQMVIGQYIQYLNKQKDTSTKSLYNKRITYLIGKLQGLQKYIFNNGQKSELNKTLESMFKNMYFKNVKTSYIGYSAEDGNLVQKDLQGAFINRQLYALQDSISNAVWQLRSSKDFLNSFKSKWAYDIKGNKLTITKAHTKYSIEFDGANPESSMRTNFEGAQGVKLMKELIYDLAKINIEDSFDIIGAQMYQGFDLIKYLSVVPKVILYHVGNVLQTDSNSLPSDLTKWKTNFIPIAKINSIVYGSDISNVVKNISRKNNLPSYGLVSLAYNFQSLADEYNRLGEGDTRYKNIYSNSFLIDKVTTLRDRKIFKKSVFGGTAVRSDVYINGQLKSPAKLTVAEVLNLAIIKDFYENFLNNKTISLQNATFADKSTHFLIQYLLDGQINNKTLKSLIEDALKGNSAPIEAIIQETRAGRITAVINNIIADYKQVFPEENITDLDSLKAFIARTDTNIIRQAFKDKHVNFYEEIHLSGKRFNETLENFYRTFTDPAKFKVRLDYNRKRFLKDLIENQFELNAKNDKTVTQIARTYSNFAENDIVKLAIVTDENGNRIELNKFDLENTLIKANVKVQLNPVLEAFFITDALLSNEYNSLLIGEVFAHPNKDKSFKKPDGYSFEELAEFGEASRLIAQIKRTVIPGATMHSFAQNLANGIAPNIKVAVMQDVKSKIQNIIGKDGSLDSMDGAGFSSRLEGRLENNALLDAAAGTDRKTIGHDNDWRFGRPMLLKWAVYDITNARRRIAINSDISLENLYKKMHDIEIPFNIDISHYIRTYGKPIYFIDYERPTQRFKLIDAKFTENGTYREYIEVDSNGNTIGEVIKESKNDRHTLFTIDQLLGGAWTQEMTDSGDFIYNEANIDIMVNMVTDKPELKNCFIAYAVNASAIKVGAGNVNSVDSWYNNEGLTYIDMQTKYIGLQMDAEHEIEDEDVSEMTQMISALIENGYSIDLVNQIYSDIGQVVDQSLAKFREADYAWEQGDKTKLYQVLGEAYIQAFESNDRDTIGLAQAFVRKATKSLKEGNITYKIPFSAETVNGIFSSTVSSLITRKGIKRKYAGFAGVQSPAYGMLQYYNIGGNRLLFDRVCSDIWNKFNQDPYYIGNQLITPENGFNLNSYKVVWAHPAIGKTHLYNHQDGTKFVDFDTIYKPRINQLLNIPEGHEERKAWRQTHQQEWDAMIQNLFIQATQELQEGQTLLISDVSLLENNINFIDLVISTDNDTFYKWDALRKGDPNIAKLWKVNVNKALVNVPIEKLLYTKKQLSDLVHMSTVRFTLDNFWASNPYIEEVVSENLTEIDWEDTVYLRNLETGVVNEIRIKTFNDYNYIRHLNDPKIKVYKSSIKPKDLKAPCTKFKINGKLFTVYDLDPVIATHYLEGGSPTEKAWAQQIVLNITGQIDFSQIHNPIQVLTLETQKQLRNLELGRPVSASAWGNIAAIATDVTVVPGEAMSGRYHAETFGLAPNENVGDVVDWQFFFNKMNGHYGFSSNLPTLLYDEILWSEGDAQFLVKKVDDLDELVIKYNLSKSRNLINLNNTVYWKGETELFNGDDKYFYTYTTNDGNTVEVILVKDAKTMEDINNSSFFHMFRYQYNSDNYKWLSEVQYAKELYRNKYARKKTKVYGELTFEEADWEDFKNAEVIKHRELLQRTAQLKYDSFKKQLRMIATRVPAQAMQSFMPVEIIAFTDSMVNDYYNPEKKKANDGSDKHQCFYLKKLL